MRSTPTSVSRLQGSHETPPIAAGARSTALATRLSGATGSYTRPAPGESLTPLAKAPFALPFLAAPRADAPGKSSGTVNAVIPIVPRQRRPRWRPADADRN